MQPVDAFVTLLNGSPPTERSRLILERLRASVAGLIGRDIADVTGESVFSWVHSTDPSKAIEPFFGVLRQAVTNTLGWRIYPGEMATLTCLRELAGYLANEFEEPDWTTPRRSSASAVHIPSRRTPVAARTKVSNVCFVLSSPRAGSTLVRVMLHGHPELFSPPELNLLPFETMGQRAEWFREHGFGWMGSGVVATVAALGQLSHQEARARIRACENADLPVADVYRELHDATRRRLLVDKSPLYAADASFLRPAAERFHEPRFVHLVRHPYAVIDSLVRMRFHRLYGSSWPGWHPSPWKYAEHCWVQMNETIGTFLRDVPQSRTSVIRFEDLLTDLETTSSTICNAFGVDFHPGLLTPYDGDRLTHHGDRQHCTLGDMHFLDHKDIDPDRGTSWQRVRLPFALDAKTVRLAEAFGYAT
ncbi:MAG: sulfotransferase [Planctomycetia bacterium]